MSNNCPWQISLGTVAIWYFIWLWNDGFAFVLVTCVHYCRAELQLRILSTNAMSVREPTRQESVVQQKGQWQGRADKQGYHWRRSTRNSHFCWEKTLLQLYRVDVGIDGVALLQIQMWSEPAEHEAWRHRAKSNAIKEQGQLPVASSTSFDCSSCRSARINFLST